MTPITAEWKDDPRTKNLCRLLLECRDALPAISTVSARLHNVDLSLADRIEKALEASNPYELKA